MRVNRKSLLLLAIFAFLIAAVAVNMSRSRQEKERDELETKLSMSQNRVKAVPLESLAAQKTELEKQLSQTAAELDSVKAIISNPISRAEAVATLFMTARAFLVEITTVTLSSSSDIELEGIPASTVSLSIAAKGDISDLVRFITTLNSMEETAAVDSVKITRTGEGEDRTADAEILLTLYTVQ